MVGSSQAILGAEGVVNTAKVKLIGNGSSLKRMQLLNLGNGSLSITATLKAWVPNLHS